MGGSGGGGEARGTKGGMRETGRKRRWRQSRNADEGGARDTTWERMSVMAVGVKLPAAYGQEEQRGEQGWKTAHHRH